MIAAISLSDGHCPPPYHLVPDCAATGTAMAESTTATCFTARLPAMPSSFASFASLTGAALIASATAMTSRTLASKLRSLPGSC